MPVQGIRRLGAKKKDRAPIVRKMMNSQVDPVDPDDTGKPIGPGAAAAPPPPAARTEPPPDAAGQSGAGKPAAPLSPGRAAGIPNPLQPGGGVKKWAGRAGMGDRERIIGDKRKKRTMRGL